MKIKYNSVLNLISYNPITKKYYSTERASVDALFF